MLVYYLKRVAVVVLIAAAAAWVIGPLVMLADANRQVLEGRP